MLLLFQGLSDDDSLGPREESGLYLAEGKIEPEVVENMRTWNHSGLSVDPSVLLRAGDQAGIERLVQYMTCCPFSLSRSVKVTETGQVVYKAEKQACRAFPDQSGDGMQSGPKRNYRILEFKPNLPAAGTGDLVPARMVLSGPPFSIRRIRVEMPEIRRCARPDTPTFRSRFVPKRIGRCRRPAPSRHRPDASR